MEPTWLSPKILYQQMLAYTTARQLEVKNNVRLNIDDIFSKGEQLVRSLEKSDDLINLAILYYDVEDLTISHAINVAILATKLAFSLNYSHEQLVRLAAVALIHDIGAGLVPPEINEKDYKKLTASEIKIFESHSVFGYETVRQYYPQWIDLAEIILQHHEKCNGQGYPNQLRCQQMRSNARLLSMIDAYEVLLHPREHRDALVPPVGIQEIISRKGTCFETGLVAALVKSISVYPVGCYVQLSTGETGRVIRTSKNNPVRPVVNLILNAEGKRIPSQTLDLSTEYLCTVRRCVPPPIDIHRLLV